jgi:hypothetical protein
MTNSETVIRTTEKRSRPRFISAREIRELADGPKGHPWMRLAADEIERLERLVAVAPDLLDLCKQMEKWLRPEVEKEPDRTYFWKLVEIIRKAEGKSSLFEDRTPPHIERAIASEGGQGG